MIIDDISKEAVGLAAAGIAAVIGAAYKAAKSVGERLRHLEACAVKKADFKRLEESTVSKEEFQDYTHRSEKARDELRDSIVSIFDKLDELKTLMIGRRH